MLATIKNRWIRALRGGNYRKVTGHLKEGPNGDGRCGFCVMGVLYDILDGQSWLGNSISSGSTSSLNGELLDEVGISNEQQGELITRNDNKESDRSFDELADYIEANL